MENVKVGYVSVKVENKIATKIHELVSAIPDLRGTPIKAYDMHMTLMYDVRNPLTTNTAAVLVRPEKVYTAKVTGIEALGDAIVLLVESDEISERFQELSILMKHSFDDHIQHVSVLYGQTDGDLEKVESVLNGLVGSDIILYGESFATIKEK